MADSKAALLMDTYFTTDPTYDDPGDATDDSFGYDLPLDVTVYDGDEIKFKIDVDKGTYEWEVKRDKNSPATKIEKTSDSAGAFTFDPSGKDYGAFIFGSLDIQEGATIKLDMKDDGGTYPGFAILTTGGLSIAAEIEYDGEGDGPGGDVYLYSQGTMTLSSHISLDGDDNHDDNMGNGGNLILQADEIILDGATLSATGGQGDKKNDTGGAGGSFLIDTNTLSLENYDTEAGPYFDIRGGEGDKKDGELGDGGVARLYADEIDLDGVSQPGDDFSDLDLFVELFDASHSVNDANVGSAILVTTAVPEPSATVALMLGSVMLLTSRKRTL
ncbi:PEP-CTERM sorting domain-containing protein [Rubritalea marina]|uniref:PEP-CTERM sorting domain-containing protein n=1 Tax=Rubritalea marina TaxID=361055 RepID=UPI00036BF02F|nr:PEP-CTERM sorting domain-containing protein [Rubritalea marina]